MKNILVTGAKGFIGKNLVSRLRTLNGLQVYLFTRENTNNDLVSLIKDADIVVHLAGVNRSEKQHDFVESNSELTKSIASIVADIYNQTGRMISIIYSSSIQVIKDNIYGKTKLNAEEILQRLKDEFGLPIYIMRLPNVFGKWCKPNYNSAVATFCYNIVNDIPIDVNDPSSSLSLAYIDDVVDRIISIIENGENIYTNENCFAQVPVYSTTVGEIVKLIQNFKNNRETQAIDRVGDGLVRALYSTYVSYFKPDQFAYTLPKHGDERGIFVEMLKTPDAGQFSFFTAHPGIVRGGHYHHTKTEKFLVIQGKARFRFLNIQTGEKSEKEVDSFNPEVVETVPGWAHDVTNIGDNNLIVMLWANEVFNPNKPDTYVVKI